FIFQAFVLPALKRKYEIIVLDRWSLSSIVYGIAAGVSPWFVRFLNNVLFKPDVVIILVGKPFDRDDVNDAYEKDEELQRQVAKLYVTMGVDNNQPGTFSVNNEGTPDEILARIVTVLTRRPGGLNTL